MLRRAVRAVKPDTVVADVIPKGWTVHDAVQPFQHLALQTILCGHLERAVAALALLSEAGLDECATVAGTAHLAVREGVAAAGADHLPFAPPSSGHSSAATARVVRRAPSAARINSAACAGTIAVP